MTLFAKIEWPEKFDSILDHNRKGFVWDPTLPTTYSSFSHRAIFSMSTCNRSPPPAKSYHSLSIDLPFRIQNDTTPVILTNALPCFNAPYVWTLPKNIGPGPFVAVT